MFPSLPSGLVPASGAWPTRLALALAVAAGASTATAAHADAAPKKHKPPVHVTVVKKTLVVRGTAADDKLALRLRAGRPDIVEIDAGDDGSAEAKVRRKRFNRILIVARGGADLVRIDEANGVFTDTETTTVDGGPGADTLLGGSGPERFLAGRGNDLVDGGRGNDVANLGRDDDVFRWDPGEGSDVVQGRDGHDVMQFNGSSNDEQFDVSANGPRVRFLRNVGNITMDLDDVEQIDTAALGGADTFTAHDLTGTDTTELNTDLAGTPGGTAGDGQKDRLIVEGTAGNDALEAAGQAGSVSVVGGRALVRGTHADPTDELVVSSLAGDDAVSASNLAADAARLTVDAGAGADRINGGRGADTLLAGDGNDFVDGATGNDLALLGAGDDTFQWDPGEGSDTIEGQAGHDAMTFNGANVGENFDVSANGQRVRFFRNVGNITMDLDDVEQIDTAALGGTDAFTVNDVSGTDLTAVNVDLAGALGGTAGDGQPDSVVVAGTSANDAVAVAGDAASVRINGLPAGLTISHPEAANDALTLNALAGDDVADASGLAAGALRYTANGGEGADVLIGSAGADVLNGDAGDDVLIGGPGLDTLDGGPGNNTVIQD
jgi:Ca2+-binding RTX toxin-like protein